MPTKKFIKSMHLKKNALHEALHIDAKKKISAKKLDKAEHSKNPKIKKEAVLAKTLEGFHKK